MNTNTGSGVFSHVLRSSTRLRWGQVLLGSAYFVKLFLQNFSGSWREIAISGCPSRDRSFKQRIHGRISDTNRDQSREFSEIHFEFSERIPLETIKYVTLYFLQQHNKEQIIVTKELHQPADRSLLQGYSNTWSVKLLSARIL